MEHLHPFTLATTEPMQRVYIDTIGPFNSDSEIIQANKGMNYVLVIIDAFSRFVQLYPIENVSAEAALHSFTSWFSNFGVPSEITTNNQWTAVCKSAN